MGIPVYVINLKHDLARRNHTTTQLNDLGIHFSIIDAVDGNQYSNEEIYNNNDFEVWKCGALSRYLLKGEIGCALSHLRIYKKIIDEDIEMACILEDDNEFAGEFKFFLEKENLITANWDLLYLGHNSKIPLCETKETQSINKKKMDLKEFFIGTPLEIPLGSYAYLIRKETARILLNKAYPLKMPIDVLMGSSSTIGVKIFLISPPCVKNCSPFGSVIFPEKFKFKYTSATIEFIESIWKKLKIWFPFLISLRKLIKTIFYFFLLNLRRSGLLKNPYAASTRVLKTDMTLKIRSIFFILWLLCL
jgi:glycosyl transferase, family 25